MSVIKKQVAEMLRKYGKAEVESRLTLLGFSPAKAIALTEETLKELRGTLVLR